VRQLNSLLAYEVRCRIVRGLHKGSNVTRARLSRSPKHHPSSLLVSLAICVLNAEYSLQIPNTYPDALFVRFARQFGDWLHLKGPRLVKRCQARSIDHLHAPTACLHLVVKQDCAALRNAFVFSLASGCPVARLFVSIKSLLGSLRPTYLMSSPTGNYTTGNYPHNSSLDRVGETAMHFS
jgi:hypothetical protein